MTPRRSHPHLAAAAAREVDAREKHYPAMIEAGAIERGDAEADLAAWRALATMAAEGSAETELPWAQLELATSRALQRREEELAAKRDSAPLRERRDAVWAIHERVVRARWFWTLDRSPPPTIAAKAA